MDYHDVIYGSWVIQEPVLQDLLQSEAMQRLKGVAQHGVTALIGVTAPFSRFDHCVGTMLLVRQLGAGLEEQIAALLHDVSHTAFSHVIDYVFNDHAEQSYHDRHKLTFVAVSDIPGILEHHGRDWRDYMDESRFSLLEQPAPALCADRLDYFLRDLAFMRLATGSEVGKVLDTLCIIDGRIAVNDIQAARWLAYTYIEVDRNSWSNPREVGLYQLAAEAISAAFKAGVIRQRDLWNTDEALWVKLSESDHPEIRSRLELVSPGTRFLEDDESPLLQVSSKVRSIDPLVVSRDSARLLSELDASFGAYRQAYHDSKRSGCSLSLLGI